MPIVLNTTKNEWEIKDPTPTELSSILLIGKNAIVEGLAGAYTNEKYKSYLQARDISEFFQA